MNIFTQRLPGLPVGLLRMMFGILWLQAALQKAPWVINAQGQRFGWLSNWLWTETQHPTFGFYKAMLEHVVLPHFTFFGYLSFVVELALAFAGQRLQVIPHTAKFLQKGESGVPR